MKFSDILTTDSLNRFQKLFPDFLGRGWVRGLEYNLVRKGGTTFPALLNATAITDDVGKYLMSRAAIFDIGDGKPTEELWPGRNVGIYTKWHRSQPPTPLYHRETAIPVSL
jgi:hypothetical protein